MVKKRRRRKNSQFPLLWLAIIGVSALLIVLLIVLICISETAPIATTEPTTAPPERNEYAPEAFYREDGFLRYANGEHLLGIDVSAHQGVIDWQKVSEDGVDFAILRIGYRGTTLGALYEDEQFRYNFEEAEKYGIKLGAYFFSQALSPEEALEEARYACDLLDGHDLDLPLYFDWEYMDGRIPSKRSVPISDCAVAFCEEVKMQGYQAGVYFNLDLAYHHLDLALLQKYHVWLAEYNEVPTFRYRFDCLQFSDDGQISGIDVPVDLDILFVK